MRASPRRSSAIAPRRARRAATWSSRASRSTSSSMPDQRSAVSPRRCCRRCRSAPPGLAARRARSGSGTTCVRSVVVDSGFLIGLFDETDALHKRCREFLKDYRGRFLTTEAVLTGVREILTADRRDFAVYRLAGKARFLDVLASGWPHG